MRSSDMAWDRYCAASVRPRYAASILTRRTDSSRHSEQFQRIAAGDHLLLGGVEPAERECLVQALRHGFLLCDRPVGAHDDVIGAKQIDCAADQRRVQPHGVNIDMT